MNKISTIRIMILGLVIILAIAMTGCTNKNASLLEMYNGGEYKGAMKEGIREGYGTMVHPNFTYIGEWKNNLPNGKGTLKTPDKVTVKCDFSDGIACGKGTIVEPNGSVYEGDIKNNQANGEGTAKFKNGGFYKGGWKNGLYDGSGEFRYLEFKYVGEYKEGKKHGFGKFVKFGKTLTIWEVRCENDIVVESKEQ